MTVFKIYEPTRTIGNGATVNFVADFQVADVTELVIKLIDTGATTNEVLQIITTDYTVAINETTENATVTFLTPPPGTKDVIIERVLDETQPTKIPDVATIRENILEGSYDKNTKLVQQLSEKIGRQLATSVVNDTLLTYDYDLPLAVDGRALFWSVSGVNASIVNSDTDLSDINAAVVASQAAQTGAELAETNAETAQANAETAETNAAASAVAADASADAAAASAATFGQNDVSYLSTTLFEVVIANGSKFIGVDSSLEFVFASARTFDITGTGGDLGALNTGSEATSTMYYLIALGDTTGAVAPHIIGVTEANYASFTTANLTGNYAAYDDYKRIGFVRNDFNGNFVTGEYYENRFFIDDFDEVNITRRDTSSATYADLDFSSCVPTVCRKVNLTITHTTGAIACVRMKGAIAGGALPSATSTGDLSGSMEYILDTSGVVQAKVSSGNARIQVTSIFDDLSVEGQ